MSGLRPEAKPVSRRRACPLRPRRPDRRENPADRLNERTRGGLRSYSRGEGVAWIADWRRSAWCWWETRRTFA